MKKRSKGYLALSEKVEKGKRYELDEAIKLVKETAVVKFDATIELVVKLNLDSKKTDQQLRGAMILPHGTGKESKVLVLATGDQAKEAKTAGADFVGDDDLIEKIEKESWFDFDVLIATPDIMPKLGKLGKKLGPKGLMPNPKTGTVTNEVGRAVEDSKKGRIEYRSDSYGNVHVIIGKVSFGEKELTENLISVVDTLSKERPSTVKGEYIKNIAICSSMGPGIKINKNVFDK